MKRVFIVIALIVFGPWALLRAEEYNNLSNAICETAQSLYNDGRIEQALRELNKCLMVQPENKCCNRLLDKILYEIQEKSQKTETIAPSKPQPVAAPKVEVPPPAPKVKLPPHAPKAKTPKAKTPKAKLPPPAPKIEVLPKIPVTLDAPEIGCVSQTIVFLATVIGEPDPGRLIYRWDFSDTGGFKGQKVERAFNNPGAYKVKLIVTDPLGNGGKKKLTTSVEKTIKIFDSPVADAGADVVTCVGSQVVFDGSKSEPLKDPGLKYSWDFGDGTTGEGIKVAHVYNNPRVYWAKLKVTNAGPAECSTSVDMKEAKVIAPSLSVASEKEMLVKISPERPGVKFQFRQPKTAGVKAFKYSWDFGDGSKAEGNPVYHVYKEGTDFTVKLTIDDGLNLPCSVSTQIIKVFLDRSAVTQEGSSR